jgi:hypothetical protein
VHRPVPGARERGDPLGDRGRGRSTASTFARHPHSAGSGPISAAAPSTATVRSDRSSQSGLATTRRIASANDASTRPPSTHASSWRWRRVAVQLLAAVGDRQRTGRSRSSPSIVRVVGAAPGPASASRSGWPTPSRTNSKRSCTASRPARATSTADRSGPRRRRARGRAVPYRLRHSSSPSMAAASSGSATRAASARTARPVAVVLRRPPGPSGKATPWSRRASSASLTQAPSRRCPE